MPHRAIPCRHGAYTSRVVYCTYGLPGLNGPPGLGVYDTETDTLPRTSPRPDLSWLFVSLYTGLFDNQLSYYAPPRHAEQS